MLMKDVVPLGDDLAWPWLDIAQYDETVDLDWPITPSTSLTMLAWAVVVCESERPENVGNALYRFVSSVCPLSARSCS